MALAYVFDSEFMEDSDEEYNDEPIITPEISCNYNSLKRLQSKSRYLLTNSFPLTFHNNKIGVIYAYNQPEKDFYKHSIELPQNSFVRIIDQNPTYVTCIDFVSKTTFIVLRKDLNDYWFDSSKNDEQIPIYV